MPEEPNPADEPKTPARRGGRRLFGFYIAAFLVLALLLSGVLLYKPLKLSYAIHQVKQTTYQNETDEWLLYCTDAACQGNRRAMEVAVDHWNVRVHEPRVIDGKETVGYSIANLACWSQPALFCEALSGRDDGELLKVLGLGRKEDIWQLVGLYREGGPFQSSSTWTDYRRHCLALLRDRFPQEVAAAEEGRTPLATAARWSKALRKRGWVLTEDTATESRRTFRYEAKRQGNQLAFAFTEDVILNGRIAWAEVTAKVKGARGQNHHDALRACITEVSSLHPSCGQLVGKAAKPLLQENSTATDGEATGKDGMTARANIVRVSHPPDEAWLVTLTITLAP